MKIIIYSKTNCGWAQEIVDFLKSVNINFEERYMLKNPAYKDEVLKKSGQSSSPTLEIAGHILADTDVNQVKKYLESISKL